MPLSGEDCALGALLGAACGNAAGAGLERAGGTVPLAQAQAAARAETEAMARVGPLQAGGSLALAVASLPLLQLLYFGLRVLLWLTAGLERLGLL